MLADSQIQSSPFTCLLTVCRVFYLDETLLWAGYVASRGERAGDYMERKTRNFYPKLLRAGIEAVPRKRIKCMSVVVRLCTRAYAHTGRICIYPRISFYGGLLRLLHRKFTDGAHIVAQVPIYRSTYVRVVRVMNNGVYHGAQSWIRSRRKDLRMIRNCARILHF